MVHLTRFKISTEFEGKEMTISLTPRETSYIIKHCKNYSGLFDYLDTLDKYVEVKESPKGNIMCDNCGCSTFTNLHDAGDYEFVGNCTKCGMGQILYLI